MKKIFTVFAATMMVASMFAGNFGILVNGKTYYAAEPLSEKDYQGRDQFKASVSLNQGDKWCIYDADNKAPFTIAIEEGEGSAKGNFTEGASDATCNVAGCYDFYIKLKWEDNSLWVQAGSNCSSTGTEIDGGEQGGGEQGGGEQGGGSQGGGVEGNPRYYYKGYIDSEDVEPSEATIFDHGLAELEVAQDAYIFILYQVDGFPGVEYMTAAYVDGQTHATVLKSGHEKFHIGAGNYTLYLYDNGDETLEVSTQPIPGKKLADPQPDQSAVENTSIDAKITKTIINGQVVIIKDGVQYNLLGAQLQ